MATSSYNDVLQELDYWKAKYTDLQTDGDKMFARGVIAGRGQVEQEYYTKLTDAGNKFAEALAVATKQRDAALTKAEQATREMNFVHEACISVELRLRREISAIAEKLLHDATKGTVNEPGTSE